MNTPVTFLIAKLLKEKGFDGESFQFYEEDGELLYSDGNVQFKTPYYVKNIPHLNYFIAPTIAEVVMWLYEKHGLWISVGIDTVFNKGKFCILLYKNRGLSLEHFPIENDKFSPYNSPKEAYEAAIEYTLTKLI